MPERAVSLLTGLLISRRITRRIKHMLPRSRIHEVSLMPAAMEVFRDTAIERRHDVEQQDVEGPHQPLGFRLHLLAVFRVRKREVMTLPRNTSPNARFMPAIENGRPGRR